MCYARILPSTLESDPKIAQVFGEVGSLTEEYDLLPGDSLVAAGMVGYAGPFAGEYRQSFEKLWLSTEDQEGITHKQGATLVSVLGQPARD